MTPRVKSRGQEKRLDRSKQGASKQCADYLFPAEFTPSIKMTRIINVESGGEFIVFGNARFETATRKG